MNGPHRVAVTGVGLVTSLGTSAAELWSNLVAGRSGVGPITRFDASKFPTRFAAEVRESLEDDDTPAWLSARKDRFGWYAAANAIRDAHLDGGEVKTASRMGIAVGTERRCPDLLECVSKQADVDDGEDGIVGASNSLASAFARRRGLKGPQLTVATACASGAQAIGLAARKIQWGEADVMVAGGCDALVDPVMLTAFGRLGGLSKRNDNPSGASRPFHRDRDGFVLSEGAGMVVLERLDLAAEQGKVQYGEILGYGCSSNAYRLTDPPPNGEGVCQAMEWALVDAGLGAVDVDYINAHATATRQNDSSEAAAIRRCLGAHVSRVPVSATKSMLGHMMCAGGAVEFIVCLLTIVHGVITPTINLDNPDPECDLNHVRNLAQRSDVRVALSNSSGFGGVNVTLVAGRVE